MQSSKKIYKFFGIIFILSLLLSLCFPVDKLFKGVALTPAIGALIASIFQLLRDQTQFEKSRYLQQQTHIFNIGATSHMANVAFDKHVEFCEEYMKEVHEAINTLFIHGPSEKIDSHLGNLIKIKRKYAAWISEEIENQLNPFEDALNKISAFSGLSTSLGPSDQEGRKNAIRKMYQIFHEIMNLKNDPEIVEHSEIAASIVKKKVRSILGVEELTKLRKILVDRALTSIEK